MASAEGGVEQLRRLILRLAVRGKVVEQDPTDESAPSWLADQRIEAQIEPENPPFDLPVGWAWVRLGDLGQMRGGGTPSKKNSEFWGGSIPWVSPKDMKRPLIDGSQDTVTDLAVEKTPVKMVPPRAILMVVRGMILAHSFPVAINTVSVTLNQDMKALILRNDRIADFVHLHLRGRRRDVLDLVERSTHGTCRLATDDVTSLLVAFPPIEEQDRIVAKVDELMALCDELEERQERRHAVRRSFQTSAMDALSRAESADDLAEAWDRVRENWGAVTEHSDSVPVLRQAVLQLAVRGRLVEQEESGDDAKLSLEQALRDRRERWEQQQLQAAQARGKPHKNSKWKTRYADPIPPDTNGLPGLPPGWTWATVEQLASNKPKAICAGPFGTIFKAKDFRPEGVPIIFLRHVKPDDYRTARPTYMDHDKWVELFQEYSVSGGELLVTKLGDPPGDCCIYPQGIGQAMLTPDVMKLELNSSLAHPRYVMHFLNSVTARQFAFRAAFGSTRLRLTLPIFRSVPIPLPPSSEQQTIVAAIDEMMALCDRLERSLTTRERVSSQLAESVVHALTS